MQLNLHLRIDTEANDTELIHKGRQHVSLNEYMNRAIAHEISFSLEKKMKYPILLDTRLRIQNVKRKTVISSKRESVLKFSS